MLSDFSMSDITRTKINEIQNSQREPINKRILYIGMKYGVYRPECNKWFKNQYKQSKEKLKNKPQVCC